MKFIILSAVLVGPVLSRGTRSCSQTCSKDIAPVCGSDGVIYTSVCDMKKKNCGKDIHISKDKLCMRSAGSKCVHKCTSTLDPVCGADSRTYLNECIFRVEQCRSGVSFAHYGPCLAKNKREKCPTTCKENPNDKPVCGSDGNVYNSTCDMAYRTCGQSVVKTSYEHCKTTRMCQDVCRFSFTPVCGSDGRIYNSKCQMQVKNCGKHIFEVPMVHCRPQERTTRGCPISCRGEKLSPVCGSNGNIYDNECDMKRLNCGISSAGKVFSVSLEKCRKKFQACERIVCPSTLDPVCGTDATTYINYCHLHKATCKKEISLAHYGACPDMNSNDDCSAPCEEEAKYEVCGSDGNVYSSMCEMKRRTCGQRVVPVALHHCEGTKHCSAKCTDEGNGAVCASNGRMYRNTCEMKARNCGLHVYEVPLKRCLSGLSFFSCLRFCPTTFDPVCGTDGKTYSNECFLQLESCRSRHFGRSLVSRIHYGKCGQPVPEAKLYMFR